MTPAFRYIKRDLEATIRTFLHKKKVLVVYGARQVGKTTLIKNLFPDQAKVLYLACDELRIKEQIIPDILALKRIIGDYQNIIFDEAQYLDNPGLVLKILIDNYPRKNIIASGSSAFDLAHQLSEPLTGRHYKFLLFPLTIAEIINNVPPADLRFHLEQSLIYGSYPEVFKLATDDEKMLHLRALVDAYLYKDILEFNLVKNSRKVRELLLALALQVGQEVSYTELGSAINVDRKTVEHYLDLLEKSFVVFRLYGFSRNQRSEINRKVKIYFWDLGVRNALINNFNGSSMRADVGVMFENFTVSEMHKKEANAPQRSNFYFWRTYEQQEVDLVSEKNGVITAYEIKLHHPKQVRGLRTFSKTYPESKTRIITKESLIEGL